MNRIIKEVEAVLYFCGILGRRERVDLVSIAWLSPSDDTEHTQMNETYDSARKLMPRLNLIRSRLRRLERIVDRFNKNQMITLTARINHKVDTAPWHKKIFLNKEIPRDVMRMTMISKASIDHLFVQIYNHQNLIVDKKLQLPIEEQDYKRIERFEKEVTRLRREYLQVRYLTKRAMVISKNNLENVTL